MSNATKRELNRLFKAQNGRCFYCGRPTERLGFGRPALQASLDHTVPSSRGGKLSDGAVMACVPCNSSKGAATLQEYRLALSFKTGCIPYRFPLEPEPSEKRDYLGLVSGAFVASMVAHNVGRAP